jgi:hypothetical protein
MVSLQTASQFIISIRVIAFVLQLFITGWMALGVFEFAGVYVKKGVKKDLLWVQLAMFALGLLYFLWNLIGDAAAGVDFEVQDHAYYCENIHYQVNSLLLTSFTTCFMLFLILKLKAIRLNGKVTTPEKVALVLTVLAFLLSIGNAATLKGKIIPSWETGHLCVGSSNSLLAIPVYFIDFVICVMVLAVFVKRVNTVSAASAESRKASLGSNDGAKAVVKRSNMEEIARNARNGGGGAILVFLANFFLSFLGVGKNSDAIILAVVLVNNLTVFLMCFVIAQATKRVWQVDKSAKIAAFYSYFASDGAAESGDDAQSANVEKRARTNEQVTGSRQNQEIAVVPVTVKSVESTSTKEEGISSMI